MPKRIPAMLSKKFVKLLTRGGAIFVRQGSTSHAIFKREKEGTVYRAPVVMGKRELSPKYMKVVLGSWDLLMKRSIFFFRDFERIEWLSVWKP